MTRALPSRPALPRRAITALALAALMPGLPAGAQQAPADPAPQAPPQAAPAGETMGAAEFDAYSRGRTFYYGSAGEPYGIEEYLPGQRVRWSFLDGRCQEGHWYEENGAICFVYEDEPEPQCWAFSRDDGGLTARFLGGGGTILYEMQSTETPLQCEGPEVGV